VLAHSTSPFAAAAGIIFGKWGDWIIAAGAAISCFGSLNGWILIQGQVPMAAADDKLFPRIFAKRNKADVPVWGLVITSLLMTILLLITASPNLVQQFQVIILMAALTSLIPYFYTTIAEIIIIKRNNKTLTKQQRTHIIIAILAGTYAFWAIFGSGAAIIFYGSILVFSSVPLYACLKRSK
ncbi:MAG: amino acid permease, partial [Gammaproteobacteria bacterium]|nr:amino acid permease [Gammaproteobacteria bacterium]